MPKPSAVRRAADLELLLSDTLRPPKRPKGPRKTPLMPEYFSKWSSSQVNEYRIGLVFTYVAVVFMGSQALANGVPVFAIAAPGGWAPVWSVLVIVGGVLAAVGAIRAGRVPVTPTIRIFNWIELFGAVLLFVTIGTYSAVLLFLAYGSEFNPPLPSGPVLNITVVSAGFIALGVRPAVRMVWLIFHSQRPIPKVKTGPAPIVTGIL